MAPMTTPANSDASDAALLAAHAAALADGIELVLAGWVVRVVEQRVLAARGAGAIAPDVLADARAAGAAAVADLVPRIRTLLDQDVDVQRTNPLAILRAAVPYPTAVLRAAAVEPVRRDEFAECNFPDDVYDLTPASFADIHPSLQELGIVWGAAKAHVHLSRRRRAQ
jgi:hypothetical protein